ncbi:MAG TPA: hypothetical protein VGV86_10095, partial [Acidimicrobiales bacterium]|nr:hypothetical protein [Acidimicrobiales bacterium]
PLRFGWADRPDRRARSPRVPLVAAPAGPRRPAGSGLRCASAGPTGRTGVLAHHVSPWSLRPPVLDGPPAAASAALRLGRPAGPACSLTIAWAVAWDRR